MIIEKKLGRISLNPNFAERNSKAAMGGRGEEYIF